MYEFKCLGPLSFQNNCIFTFPQAGSGLLEDNYFLIEEHEKNYK